jgi:hypothetical protein
MMGHFYDRASSMTDIADVTTNLPDPTDLTERLLEIAKSWEGWYKKSTNPNIKDVILASLLRQFPIEISIEHESRLEDKFLSWRTNTQSPSKYFRGTKSQLTELEDFERCYFSRIHDCQMFAPKRYKNIGIVAGNCNVQVGDEIWFLTGGLSPFVLEETINTIS